MQSHSAKYSFSLLRSELLQIVAECEGTSQQRHVNVHPRVVGSGTGTYTHTYTNTVLLRLRTSYYVTFGYLVSTNAKVKKGGSNFNL